MPQNPSPSEYLDLRTAPADLVQAARDEGDIGVEKWLRAQPLDVLETAKEKRYIRLQAATQLCVLEEEIEKKRERRKIEHLASLRRANKVDWATLIVAILALILTGGCLVVGILQLCAAHYQHNAAPGARSP